MTNTLSKNLPVPDFLTQPYWDGCREGKLLLQRCAKCNRHQFYPRLFCTSCSSRQLEWSEASGRGQVLSYTVVRHAVSKAYEKDIPFIVALITLDEGPTMMSSVVQCDPEEVSIGAPVKATFQDWGAGMKLPVFRLKEKTDAP